VKKYGLEQALRSVGRPRKNGGCPHFLSFFTLPPIIIICAWWRSQPKYL